MNSKERVRAVLNHGPVDRLAFVPCIDPYFRSGLDSPFNQMDIYDLQALCGTDILRGVCCYRTRFDDAVRHVQGQGGPGEVVDIFETPYGTLKEVHRFTEQSPYIPFPTEYLIKTEQDLKVFRYLLDHVAVEPDYDTFRVLAGKFEHLMVSCSVEDTALRQLLTKKIGVENFVYLMYDHPSEMQETLQALADHHNQILEVSAQGPAEVFISYENTNTGDSSPEWFQKYELPLLNRYADTVHQFGKKLLIHMCGRIRLLVDSIVNARFDGIIDVSPPPTGDLEFRQAIPTFTSKKRSSLAASSATPGYRKEPGPVCAGGHQPAAHHAEVLILHARQRRCSAAGRDPAAFRGRPKALGNLSRVVPYGRGLTVGRWHRPTVRLSN